MEYSNVFRPVSEHLKSAQAGTAYSSLIGKHIKFGVEGLEWSWLSEFKVALIGLRKKGGRYTLSPIREAFYGLFQPQKAVPIIDLGDIEITDKLDECAEKVEFALEHVLQQGVFPIVFGEQIGLAQFAYTALKIRQRHINVSCILPSLSMGATSKPLSDDNFMSYIMNDFGMELQHFSVIGIQHYLCAAEDLVTLQENYSEVLRLGALRDNIEQAEPLLRHADIMVASMSAVRQSDAPAAMEPGPNGLYAEEFCRLLRYAGFSDELKACYLGGFRLAEDIGGQTTRLIAQALWHLYEGIAYRVGEKPNDDRRSCRCLQVELGETGQELVFYQGKVSGRWWLEVPLGNTEQALVVPCQHQDYEQTVQFEVPDKWLWFFKKYTGRQRLDS